MAFKIIFSEERTFGGFPIPLITMLVMMLGELEYVDKIFPETTRIVLRKKNMSLMDLNEDLREDFTAEIEDEDDLISTYIGESDDEKDFLQFSGDIARLKCSNLSNPSNFLII